MFFVSEDQRTWEIKCEGGCGKFLKVEFSIEKFLIFGHEFKIKILNFPFYFKFPQKFYY